MLFSLLLLVGCSGKKETDPPQAGKELDNSETKEELYEKAKKEDVLIVYTVSTRATKVKESFEKEYPGLFVEVRDLRSPDLIEAVEEDYTKGLDECDIVICNDNSGEFKSRLIDTGIVLPYLPKDIKPHMKNISDDGTVSFVYEAQMVFYNEQKYESIPETNLWALTDEKYKGRIYMPNPLRSFSAYAFCSSSLSKKNEFADSYYRYYGKKPEADNAAELFWESIFPNIVFTNSSDEVAEALADGSADFGFMVSSKLRLKDVGYRIEPAYSMEPFCGCLTSYSVMLAKNSKNMNTAKLFIRYLLGEADGTGDGYKPFSQPGTWSARNDVQDGTEIALDELALIIPDIDILIKDKEKLESFWSKLLKINIGASE